MPTIVPTSAEPMSGPNRRPQVLSSSPESSKSSMTLAANIGIIMITTALAGSTTAASAIVPTTANPKPDNPFTTPETVITTVRSRRNVTVSVSAIKRSIGEHSPRDIKLAQRWMAVTHDARRDRRPPHSHSSPEVPTPSNTSPPSHNRHRARGGDCCSGGEPRPS